MGVHEAQTYPGLSSQNLIMQAQSLLIFCIHWSNLFWPKHLIHPWLTLCQPHALNSTEEETYHTPHLQIFGLIRFTSCSSSQMSLGWHIMSKRPTISLGEFYRKLETFHKDFVLTRNIQHVINSTRDPIITIFISFAAWQGEKTNQQIDQCKVAS